MAALSILRPGMLTTVQDEGRWGFQSRGVPVSGAMDWYSHRLANQLLGNDRAVATLEVTLMGPQIRFETSTAVAVTGADFHLTLDDVPVAMNRMIEVTAGGILKFGERLRGARAYVAVRGGIDVPIILGSRSTHVLTRLGGHEGRALKAGDMIAIGVRGEGTPRPLALTPFTYRTKLRVIPAQERLFAQLCTQQFRVSPQSDRMGYRLDGGNVADAPTGERMSVALPTGAIQVPPTGKPIVLMNDHATTGGYALAGAVITADLPIAGQLAPGDWIEFEACSLETADAALRKRERQLDAA
ncbi:MAG TPA: biotin-dependent carboxyltransferase family protein [Vicinamibacterales bacterium]|nr:biotin-dependent carboxyltransferase family protein [Vicinamibacterales bacterium]